MSTSYYLVNDTKKEIISFLHLPVSTLREITGNPVSSAICTWYIAMNTNDKISLLSEHKISKDQIENYTDQTDKIIEELIKNKILKDEGYEKMIKDEPGIFYRKIKNIWME
jgi:hypothetical protein